MATLEISYLCSGDNTYTLSNTILIPYSSNQRDAEYHREYNFYLSQLRIWIKMFFGRLTTKWRFFFKSLIVWLKKSLIIQVGAKVHNHVINADQLSFASADVNKINTFGIQTVPNAFYSE